MKYIKETYLKEIELSDLDLDNQDDILGHNPSGHNYELITEYSNDNMYWTGEAQQVKIDLLIKTLNKIKKAGANYVELLHHEDHHGYVLYGVELREATEAEIMVHKIGEKDKEIEERLEKISRLEQ